MMIFDEWSTCIKLPTETIFSTENRRRVSTVFVIQLTLFFGENKKSIQIVVPRS